MSHDRTCAEKRCSLQLASRQDVPTLASHRSVFGMEEDLHTSAGSGTFWYEAMMGSKWQLSGIASTAIPKVELPYGLNDRLLRHLFWLVPAIR